MQTSSKPPTSKNIIFKDKSHTKDNYEMATKQTKTNLFHFNAPSEKESGPVPG
jgi:hypothetical protein